MNVVASSTAVQLSKMNEMQERLCSSRDSNRYVSVAGPVAHPATYTMVTGSFPGVKRPDRGVDHPPQSRAEFEGRVELYICSPSGPSWLF